MKNGLILFALILAATALGVNVMGSHSVERAKKETAFERVVRTGTIRCGYALWDPQMIKDPNTGNLSGYDYDVINEMGSVLGLKVDWVEEYGWGTAEQGLVTGRYDIACNSFWAHPPRAKGAEYSIPFLYLPLFPVVRPGLNGPEDSFAWLNNPEYKMLILSGTIGEIVAKRRFPQAKLVDAFSLSAGADAMMNITTGKADFTFSDWTTANRFLMQNPGGIKILPTMIEVTSSALLLPNDDPRMKVMVDKALAYLLDSGFVRETMTRHLGQDQRVWLHPTAHYESAPPVK